MYRSLIGIAATITMVIVAPTVALAHPGLDHVHGFTAGFVHPMTGVDHILAMTAVGLLAAQLGGRALWLVPLTFMALMLMGGILGMSHVSVPFVETGIAVSIIAFGLVLLLGIGLSTSASVALVGFFAIFHGHAHGAEMPVTAAGLAYGAGFVCATGLLHLTGIAAGLSARKADPRIRIYLFRGAGTLFAFAGTALLMGAI